MAENSTILKGAVSTSKANSKIKYIVGGVVIVGLIAYLIISSISSAGAYYREVGEVLAQRDALAGKNLRVSGNIVTESVKYDSATLDLNFMISDPADATKTLPVYFHGVQPDQITREGASAIVEGSLGPNGVVEANNLLLKCPSRYEESGMEEIKVEAIQ
ncbi:MAG: cytochrome c maturation protein CcmE [Anaerolineae bacterium]|nr:cytochrome c maturation protein CcmE [Anaerolineae bacterium]